MHPAKTGSEPKREKVVLPLLEVRDMDMYAARRSTTKSKIKVWELAAFSKGYSLPMA